MSYLFEYADNVIRNPDFEDGEYYNILVIESFIEHLKESTIDKKLINARMFLGGVIIDFTFPNISKTVFSIFTSPKGIFEVDLLHPETKEYIPLFYIDKDSSYFEELNNKVQEIIAELW